MSEVENNTPQINWSETEVDSVGLKLKIKVPATVADYDLLAGKDGACLESANSNEIYRSILNESRARTAELAEKLSGIARKTKPGKTKKDGSVGDEEYDESEGKYIQRVLAQLGRPDDTIGAVYPQIADMVLNGYTTDELDADGKAIVLPPLAFNPKAKVRTITNKAPAKTFQKAAQAIIDAQKGETAAANLSNILGRTVEATLESLAAAIRDAEAKEKETLATKYA